jgi:hypothetical protein
MMLFKLMITSFGGLLATGINGFINRCGIAFPLSFLIDGFPRKSFHEA